MPQTKLLHHADLVLTMNDAGREIRGGGILIEGNRITAVGADAELPDTADEIIDLSGHILLPGLVNTHHHICQSSIVGTGSVGVHGDVATSNVKTPRQIILNGKSQAPPLQANHA
jgi:cytosine/adenosine deaminase-related metal-dependent hydrolase